MNMHTRTHLKQSGYVEKSNENQEMQSIEIAKNPLNFDHADEGLDMCGSAQFTHI